MDFACSTVVFRYHRLAVAAARLGVIPTGADRMVHAPLLEVTLTGRDLLHIWRWYVNRTVRGWSFQNRDLGLITIVLAYSRWVVYTVLVHGLVSRCVMDRLGAPGMTIFLRLRENLDDFFVKAGDVLRLHAGISIDDSQELSLYP